VPAEKRPNIRPVSAAKAAPPSVAARPGAGSGRPPGKPARPNVDLVPSDQRAAEERTAIMPNAPGRVPAQPSFTPPQGPSMPPAAAATPPPPAHTIAMHAGAWTPPVAGGRIGHARASATPPPPNVRVQPSALPPHLAVSITANLVPRSRARGAAGLVLYAAALALALAALAGLALS
jgi:hypothetical protein